MTPKPEILWVGAAFATVVTSCTWFGYFVQRSGNRESMAEDTVSVPTAYQKNTYDAGAPAIVQWAPPPVQSRSGAWVYDVFTPPEIFYDAKLAKFTVTPPVTLRAEEQPKAPDGERLAGLQVVEVKQSPFRLQLIGYVKTHNEYSGLFENGVTGGVLLASKSRTLPELGLVIENIDVRRTGIFEAANMAGSQLVAVASIRDAVTGELITLSTAGRCFSPEARATLVASSPSPTEREVGEGDVWESEGVTYEIEKIHVSPAAVVIKRRDGGASDIERFTLSLPGATSPEFPAPSL